MCFYLSKSDTANPSPEFWCSPSLFTLLHFLLSCLKMSENVLCLRTREPVFLRNDSLVYVIWVRLLFSEPLFPVHPVQQRTALISGFTRPEFWTKKAFHVERISIIGWWMKPTCMVSAFLALIWIFQNISSFRVRGLPQMCQSYPTLFTFTVRNS